MTIKETERAYRRILELLSQGSIKDALDDLFRLIVMAQEPDFRVRLEKNNEIYKNLLKYTAEGIEDPDRTKIYNKLLVSIYELADMVYQNILTHHSGMQIYQMKKELETRMEWHKEQAADEEGSLALSGLFNMIWLTDRFVEQDIHLILSIRQSGEVPWYEKCVIVSALTVSLIRCFDINKLDLLLTFFEDGQEQIWQRALVGLILGMYLYDNRLPLYPTFRNRLTLLKDRPGLAKEMEMVLVQLLRSKDTERITKKLQEEILPEVARLAPKLEDKLDLDRLISRDPMEEKNPEWEDFFKDTPDLYQKMEEFTNLQMEGSDVFWGAFAMLKHFDFFRNIHHWFLPFHQDNQIVRKIFDEQFKGNDSETFLDGLTRSAFLCNSDKYSFCLNIRFLSDIQKSLLLNFFSVELKNLNEITDEDALLNKSTKDKFIFTQYIQDLYRFHKLYTLKNELTDIFGLDLDMHQTWFLSTLVEDTSVIKNLAEFYFERDHFNQARDIYQMLNRRGEQSYEIFEKIGYCYQKSGRYSDALSYYLKADLFDSNKIWLLKKIALCYRKLKQYDEAIRYYKEVLKFSPDDITVLASIGYCYLDKNDTEEALNYFFKIEFLSTDEVSALRPIAWIFFIQGNFDQAASYYSQLISKAPNKYDYMNFGHVEWCMGNKKAAIHNYKLSIRQKDNSLDQFMAGFNADQPYLLKHGIPAQDIPLMVDYLKYSLDSVT